MERPAHLIIRKPRFAPRRIAAISGALVLEAAAIYAVASALSFSGLPIFPHAVQVEFLKEPPPKEQPVVLPQLRLVEPPTPIVPPPEIQIRTPPPPRRITVAKVPRHLAMPAFVQIAGPPAPPAPPKPRGITAPVSIGASHSCGNRYPFLAVRLNQQGTTTVRFTVNIDGSVSNVQLAKSSGHEMLDEAAIGCAYAWRYRPALEDGRPVAAPWTTNVQWKLRNGLPV
jgi:periplasmic protein TonB